MATQDASAGKAKVVKVWLGSLAAFITALAGLATAIAAFRKPPEEPAAKVSYEALQKAVTDLSTEDQALRSDLVALRNSFAEYVQVKEGASNFVPEVPSAGAQSRITVQVAPTPVLVPGANTVPAPSAGPLSTRRPVVLPAPRASAMRAPALPSFSEIQKDAKGL